MPQSMFKGSTATVNSTLAGGRRRKQSRQLPGSEPYCLPMRAISFT
jgi:hypothetical protein